MIFREAQAYDIPSIVELLRLSLGESLMPKTEAYWRWKHVDNHFGSSKVLLAVDNEELVGVRAFMHWNWEQDGKVFRSVRAVDTATHPRYQGKGIFTKLTLSLLETCHQDGIDFVFNTPNSKSLPGYIKMGWQEVGRMPVKVSLKRPFSVIVNKLRGAQSTGFMEINDVSFLLSDALTKYKGEFVNGHENSNISTTYSGKFIRWRYMQIPIIKYYGHADSDALIVFRLKNSSLGLELRITDCFGNKTSVRQLIKQVYKSITFDYISLSGLSTYQLTGFMQKSFTNGPNTTFRKLNINLEEVQNIISFNNWHPTLGDLEVF
ncbi:MAG: GNAT family N-acetyltransferase [Bacteroidota bacterium]